MTVHKAGLPSGPPPVQRCARCLAVLIDRTGEMRLAKDTDPIVWYEVGASVELRPGFSAMTTVPPTCRVVPGGRP